MSLAALQIRPGTQQSILNKFSFVNMADELDASQKDSKVKGILKHTPSLEDPR